MSIEYKAKLVFNENQPPRSACYCQYCENEWQRIMDERDPDGWMSRLQSFMIVCPDCGCKRCPRATYHGHDCTASNKPGQSGSTYGDFELDTVWMDAERDELVPQQDSVTAPGSSPSAASPEVELRPATPRPSDSMWDVEPEVELCPAASRLATLIEDGGFDWWTPEIAFDLALWLVDEGMVMQPKAETDAHLSDLINFYGFVVVREEPSGDDQKRAPAMWEYLLHSGWARVGQSFNPDDQTPTLPVTTVYTRERTFDGEPT